MVPQAILIGSANTETILLVSKDVVVGEKQTFRLGAKGIGGSAINWIRWLNAANIDFEVLCPIGSDTAGDQIRDLMKIYGIKPNFGYDLVPSDDLDNNKTPHSYIIVSEGSRTVLSSQSATRRHLDDVESKISKLTEERNFHVAMIGNVPTDQTAPKDTIAILRAMPENVFIYANGRVQFRHSLNAWGENLSRIDCFQFAIHEAKSFADTLNEKKGSTIHEALETFIKLKLNVIITLGRMGAISVFGQFPQINKQVFFTWPTQPKLSNPTFPCEGLHETLDPTGAGDAFGAGFIASISYALIRNKNLLQTNKKGPVTDALVRALDTGATLGSWACCGLGGSAICPSTRGSIFAWIGCKTGATMIRNMDAAANLLYAIDR